MPLTVLPITLFHGVISMLIFVLFTIKAIRFSPTVKISSLLFIFPTLINPLDIPNFLKHETAYFFTKTFPLSYYIVTVI